jgi:hypothetical protein
MEIAANQGPGYFRKGCRARLYRHFSVNYSVHRQISLEFLSTAD